MPSPNTLRGLGRATIGIDKPTQARLKRLAGDTPLCQKVRELIEQAERAEFGCSGNVPFPGQELLASPNTRATKADVSRLEILLVAKVAALEAKITAMGDARGIKWNTGLLRDNVKTDKARSVTEGQFNFSEVESR